MEKEKITNWLPTDKRFVAFIDILGFKDLVMRNSHLYIYDLLTEISKLRYLIDNWKDSKENSRYVNSEMYTVSFSDSIVVFSKSDSIEDFDLFTYGIKWLFSGAINKKIPLKGAMAYGEISINKSNQIYFGQPIIDAYLLEEEVNYFGVVAHNSYEKYYYENIENSVSLPILSEFETPLKCGNISHLNLLWFQDVNNNDDETDFLKKIRDFKNDISGSPRRYIDNTLNILNEFKE